MQTSHTDVINAGARHTFNTPPIPQPLGETILAWHCRCMAFITAGCTHATYAKALKVMGIDAVDASTFMSTIKKLHPIVEKMVEELCEKEKMRMKAMDQKELGSWERAVTSADGAWMTRGFHSTNMTFSIRNFFTGALLFFKHVCQKGRDKIIEEPLYKGTSKSAEARELMAKAKEEGLIVEIHWQDGDSSSSKSVEKIFPKAKVMICGGHAGRSHLKQLQALAKKKTFTKAFQEKHKEIFPDVLTARCTCENRKHRQGCGCLTDSFCQRARNNFSTILSESQSERDCKLWSTTQRTNMNGTEGIFFHELSVCSCGKCSNNGSYKCEGKNTRRERYSNALFTYWRIRSNVTRDRKWPISWCTEF